MCFANLEQKKQQQQQQTACQSERTQNYGENYYTSVVKLSYNELQLYVILS